MAKTARFGLVVKAKAKSLDVTDLLQVFSYTKKKALQADDLCLDVSALGGPVKLYQCHGLGGNQLWQYNHEVSRRLLTELNLLQQQLRLSVNTTAVLLRRLLTSLITLCNSPTGCLTLPAPCGLQGCGNRPTPFPDRR